MKSYGNETCTAAQRYVYNALMELKKQGIIAEKISFPVHRLPLVEYDVFYGFILTKWDFLRLIFGIRTKTFNPDRIINAFLNLFSQFDNNGVCILDVDAKYFVVTNVTLHTSGLNREFRLADNLYVMPYDDFIRRCYGVRVDAEESRDSV
ncbi:MAG: hypothetical protein QXQ02_06125 [Halobacteria archaeon]